jgi:hypothetical protein
MGAGVQEFEAAANPIAVVDAGSFAQLGRERGETNAADGTQTVEGRGRMMGGRRAE